jgi:uncharacterized protein
MMGQEYLVIAWSGDLVMDCWIDRLPDWIVRSDLIWAARHGAVRAMTALLDAGADAARDRRTQWTPFLHAIHRRRLEAVRLLLERGADPNMRTESLTPLLMAATEPDAAFVRLLLSYGADPRARGNGGATALSQAVSGGALSDIDRPLFGGCRTVRS